MKRKSERFPLFCEFNSAGELKVTRGTLQQTTGLWQGLQRLAFEVNDLVIDKRRRRLKRAHARFRITWSWQICFKRKAWQPAKRKCSTPSIG